MTNKSHQMILAAAAKKTLLLLVTFIVWMKICLDIQVLPFLCSSTLQKCTSLCGIKRLGTTEQLCLGIAVLSATKIHHGAYPLPNF